MSGAARHADLLRLVAPLEKLPRREHQQRGIHARAWRPLLHPAEGFDLGRLLQFDAIAVGDRRRLGRLEGPVLLASEVRLLRVLGGDLRRQAPPLRELVVEDVDGRREQVGLPELLAQ
eukprot:7162538-Prymnesium_polylepis.1